jgi:ribosomal protein L22
MYDRERERRQKDDNNYHTLIYSKHSICRCIYTKKSISKFKSLLFSLTKNTTNNPLQKLLEFYIQNIFFFTKFMQEVYRLFFQPIRT